jgi:DNA-binding transcriptional LysR family regulator
MNSMRLKYFLAVCETKSIRKAAEILNLSPAALSRAIKCLEDELDQSLLIARGRGIEITSIGQNLADRSRPFLQGLDNIKKEIKEQSLSHHKRIIRLGSFEIFTTYLLQTIIPVIPKTVDFILQELLPGLIEEKLLSKEIDYAITYLPIPTQGISHKCVASTPMNIFGRSGLFDGFKLEDLPFVIPLDPFSGLPHSSSSLDGWPHQERKRHTPYRVSLLESALELCRQGRAVAYLPNFIARLHNKVAQSSYHLTPVPFDEHYAWEKRMIYLVKREDDPVDLFFQNLETQLINIC